MSGNNLFLYKKIFMVFNKIFKFPNKAAEKNLEPTLCENLCTYTLSCLWTRDTNLSLGGLVGRIEGDTQWHNIIVHPVTDNDGEITIQLGTFCKSINLEIAFDLFPLEDIPACALFITNITDNSYKKVTPDGDNMQLKKGVGWRGHIATKLF